MKTRRLHRALGIILLLPFFGWTVTGLVFFLKPGYADAYEILQPKRYPVDAAPAIVPGAGWLEFRYLETVLGGHLLVRTAEGWMHLDPREFRPRALPEADDVRRLLNDAFSSNPQRYGNITEVSGNTAFTDTGIEIAVDWNRLNFRQRGRDTAAIDALYRIHYLQWTGIRSVDNVLGVIGLLMLAAMSVLGVRLAFFARRPQ